MGLVNICKAEELKPAGGLDYILGERNLGRWLLYFPPINQKDPPGSWQLFAWHGGMAFVRSLRLRASGTGDWGEGTHEMLLS